MDNHLEINIREFTDSLLDGDKGNIAKYLTDPGFILDCLRLQFTNPANEVVVDVTSFRHDDLIALSTRDDAWGVATKNFLDCLVGTTYPLMIDSTRTTL